MSDLPARILNLGREKTLPKGTQLFRDEETADRFYFVRSGEVRVFKLDDQGREFEVARIGQGDFVGEAVALNHGRFPFFAQAVGEIRVLVFDLAAVERAIAADSAAARFFIRLLARKCVRLSARVESLGMRTVRQRLAEYLLSRCGGESGCSIDLPITKGDLARSLGTVGETLSRTLRLMRDEGLIEVKGKMIRVIDCPRLKSEIN